MINSVVLSFVYAALIWIIKTSDVSGEMEAMKKERQDLRNSPKFCVLDLMRTSDWRWPLIICIVLQMSQQFSGINAKSLETYSFLPFSVMLLLYFIFTYMFVPETKGKSISEITQLFKSPTMDRSEFRNSYKSSKNRYSTQVLIIDPPLSEKGTEYYIESSYL